MRQTIKEIEVNVAFRWFLGLGLTDKVPHFSTFSKNYVRRFKDMDIFEQIFSRILDECIKHGLVDPRAVFVDATHVKACANSKKATTEIVKQEAMFYEAQLKKEINENREAHGKKPLRDMESNDSEDGERDESDNDFPDNPGTGGATKAADKEATKEEKRSTTDPGSGWFHKGDHKQVLAYVVETACERHGWILGYTVNRGNLHDSRTFKGLYDKIKNEKIEAIIADAGYKNPAIAKLLIGDGIMQVFPYTRPQTKKGFFKKYEFVYDEYYDCYICSEGKILSYSTTNRGGYREYKSCPGDCVKCPCLSQCTKSRNQTKVVTRHIWEHYMEECEDIRHREGSKELYAKRKETIERLFGTAKELHGFRYTQMKGTARMEMKVGLTYACMNLKKLAGILCRKQHPTGFSIGFLMPSLVLLFSFSKEQSSLSAT